MVINEIHIENVKGLQSFDLKQPIQPNEVCLNRAR